MEKLKFRTISSNQETNLFLKKIENHTEVRLPLNYATNGKIVGVFIHKQLVAGYMLITKPGFRSLLFVPEKIKNSHRLFLKDQYEMMEVNGLWISPTVKTPHMQYKIWINLVKDIFFSRKKYLLLMCDANNKTIEHIHSLTSPEPLYEGKPNIMAGEKTHTSIRVSYTTRWNIVLNIPKYWMELKSRERRAKESARQRDLARTST
ncbi:MAG: hypothetical protein QGG67_16370 [Gammaproteobacteria bacterium]|jgi:hypothetical protein|nr:hypothetical protein [Gammaproteobacteria bacterium]MDP6097541.1 hypothetical protein [Gammaproteobacteria bacterium]HJO11069.1 hypothetical protein [Gammaproteobacteria bacterium]|tara:strand:- start:6142 stop:6756 length:615 start_codon:yes stop_codon:yes gene_type:complete